MNKYSVRAVESLLSKLVEMNYDCHNINEGCLGCGDWLCIAPDERHYNFEIKEVYLNEWSSAHTVRRFTKMSKRQFALLNSMEG